MTELTVGTERDGRPSSSTRSSLRAAAIGNALEWFDWTLYGAFSTYLAANFFASGDPTSALLATLAVFAGGFLARPLGGLLFGRIGDRLGRKFTLVVTMSLLASASLAIALIPSYSQIGAWASALLLLARLVQGLAHGGETGVAYTYAAEIAPRDRRALWTSGIMISVTVGVMAATALGALLTAVLDAEDMSSWGWRLGFGIGAILGLFALWMRRHAVETAAFENQSERIDPERSAPAPLPRRQLIRTVALIVMFFSGTNVVYYAWIVFAPSNAVSNHNMDPSSAFIAGLAAQSLALVFIPVFGKMSDRFGRRPMVIAFGIGAALIAFPVQALVGASAWTLFLSMAIGIFVWSFTAGTFPALMAEQFPTRSRALGVGVVSSFCAAVFGGTAPYLNAWSSSIGASWIFQAYIVILALVTAVAGIVMRETRGADLTAEVMQAK
ncbi:MFS transporter [Rhodococcus sp. NCIMB 12038]|uniref:MFS transporter n=1 Tax=Rhodococcus sp. NCIMB 12038 TaxID=933800 RepID=UPI000B3C3DB4|nr:MFS transporter [Rhodococcus sp. NCIMB 12038]OUS92844.1 MFS transporter [Rhodococcus sp. NCIMB 12038]